MLEVMCNGTPYLHSFSNNAHVVSTWTSYKRHAIQILSWNKKSLFQSGLKIMEVINYKFHVS